MIILEKGSLSMKRILCILLCLLMIFGISACKPDNITYPSTVTPPEDQTVSTDPDPSTDPNTSADQTDTTPSVQQPEDSAAEEGEESNLPETDVDTNNVEQEQPQPESAANPLAAEGFTPTAGTLPTLQSSGIIKEQGAALSALKNRTIVLYTANDQPAFTYTDEKGAVVTEWQWMEKIAAENGFILKYSIKPKAVSLKAQRVALYSGKRLSLLQFGIEDLAAGLGLSASTFSHLNLETTTYGISKAVLNQSGGKLFAPIGNANTLWYNPALLPADLDPQTLSHSKQWNLGQYKTAYNYAAAAKIMPTIMSDPLAWATLSGKSPLTLLDGKLDSNINAQSTRNVWSTLRTMQTELTPFEKEEGASYSLKNGNVAFEFTNNPTPAEGSVLKYALLPAAAEETAGTATFTGTFLALPKYETNEDNIHAALSFAELWCNRFTEVRAAKLQSVGIKGADYQTYCNLTEACGHLILRDSEIEKAAEAYLNGLKDPTLDMDAAYAEAKPRIDALIATRNLYY